MAVAVVPHPPPARLQCRFLPLPLPWRPAQLLHHQASADHQQNGHLQPGTPLCELPESLCSSHSVWYMLFGYMYMYSPASSLPQAPPIFQCYMQKDLKKGGAKPIMGAKFVTTPQNVDHAPLINTFLKVAG